MIVRYVNTGTVALWVCYSELNRLAVLLHLALPHCEHGRGPDITSTSFGSAIARASFAEQSATRCANGACGRPLYARGVSRVGRPVCVNGGLFARVGRQRRVAFRSAVVLHQLVL